MKHKCKYELTIKAMTENKESIELMDYDTQFDNIASLTIKNEGIIIRSKGVISFLPTLIIPDDTQKLLTISSNHNGYNIHTDSYEHSNTLLNAGWLVYKLGMFPPINEKEEKYQISIGDIIKIGRVKLKVKHLSFKSNSNNNSNQAENKQKDYSYRKINENQHDYTTSFPQIIHIVNQNHIKSKKKLMSKICRICLSNDNDNIEENEYDNRNPLIQPCQCSGTMKDIHLNCLRHWLQSKIITKVDENNIVTTFLIKQVECELCKSKLPDYIKHKNEYLEIVNFDTTAENYIILETNTIDSKGNKYVFIISFDQKNEITFGRGYDCDIVLPDSSVSRLHGAFIKKRNKLFLKDCNSKFGSLVLIQSPQLNIIDGLQLNVQIGRTCLSIKIQYPFSLFGCCFPQINNSDESYQYQNEKYLNKYRGSIVKEEVRNDDDNNENNSDSSINIAKENNQMIKRKSEQSEHFLKIIENHANYEKGQGEHANMNKVQINNVKTILPV